MTLINQRELVEFAMCEQRIGKIEEELKHWKEKRELAEQDLLTRFDAGATCERGRFTLGINVQSKKSPKWKEEFAKVAGPVAVAAVIEATEPKVTRKVVVVEAGR